MEVKNKYEFVDIEPYLFAETRILLAEIESKIPHKVMLWKVYGLIETWQVSIEVPWHINMPENDEGNIECFTHELLHIYFDFCLNMRLSDLILPMETQPYFQYYDNPYDLINHFIHMINNLQHHKMIPYFEKFDLPIDKIVNNYYDISNIYKVFDKILITEFKLNSQINKYIASILYSNFLVLKLYFPNPVLRKELIDKFESKFDNKFVGLRNIFEPVIKKWNVECNNSKELILEINNRAKDFAGSV